MHPVWEKANVILNAKKLTCHKGLFEHTIEIHHQDGSTFILHNATAKIRLIDKQRMLLVWTEHCGYHAFFCEDLEFWRKYESL